MRKPKPEKISMVRLLDAVSVAQRRVGETSAQRLRWLLDFARKDLTLLHGEERRALSYDLRALTVPPNFTDSRTIVIAPQDESLVEQLHSTINQVFAALTADDNRGWQFKQPGQVTLQRKTKLNAKRLGFVTKVSFVGMVEHDAILHAVMEILIDAGDQLRACAECRSLFIPVRRQEYCSIKCSQRARDRRRSK